MSWFSLGSLNSWQKLAFQIFLLLVCSYVQYPSLIHQEGRFFPLTQWKLGMVNNVAHTHLHCLHQILEFAFHAGASFPVFIGPFWGAPVVSQKAIDHRALRSFRAGLWSILFLFLVSLHRLAGQNPLSSLPCELCPPRNRLPGLPLGVRFLTKTCSPGCSTELLLCYSTSYSFQEPFEHSVWQCHRLPPYLPSISLHTHVDDWTLT